MPRTKTNKNKKMKKSMAMPYLYIALPELKKSGPLFIAKAGVGLPSMSSFTSLKKPGSEAGLMNKPKPPTVSMGSNPKPKAPKLPGLTSHGANVLSQVPDKSIKAVDINKEEEDQDDEDGEE